MPVNECAKHEHLRVFQLHKYLTYVWHLIELPLQLYQLKNRQ